MSPTKRTALLSARLHCCWVWTQGSPVCSCVAQSEQVCSHVHVFPYRCTLVLNTCELKLVLHATRLHIIWIFHRTWLRGFSHVKEIVGHCETLMQKKWRQFIFLQYLVTLSTEFFNTAVLNCSHCSRDSRVKCQLHFAYEEMNCAEFSNLK